MPSIRTVATEADLNAARRLFAEYARSLPFALDFQDFQKELDTLPGVYVPPGGGILIAEGEAEEDALAGCVALRPLARSEGDPPGLRFCEMKRLYVRPAHRGSGLGRALGKALLHEARGRGYDAMRLDTVASMEAANALYRALGFHEIEAYCRNPLDTPVFFEKRF